MAAALALVCGGLADAALSTTTAAAVDRLRTTFTNELAKYDKSHEESVAAVRDQYAVALVALERKFTGAGSLESVLAVRKESSRFVAERALRTSDLVGEPSDLFALQQQYIKKFEALPGERACKVVRLAELYAKNLRTLEEGLTRKRMIDDAIGVKNLRESVSSIPAVAGATLILSTIQAEQPQQTNSVSPEAKANPTEQPGPAVSHPAPRVEVKKKYSGSSAGRIRAQFDVYAKAIRQQNWPAAGAIVDPAEVKVRGTRQVEDIMRRFSGPFGNENDAPHLKVDLRSVEVEADDRTASGTPRISNFGFARELPSLRWVQTEGDWYIDLKATMNERRDERRDEPRRPGPANQR